MEDHGKMPKNFKEKGEFKENYVKTLALDLSKEVNFGEALSNAFLLFQDNELSPQL